MGDISAHLNNNNSLSITDLPLKPTDLAELIGLIDSNTISNKIAKDVLPELLAQGGSPESLIEQKGLIQISDTGAIEKRSPPLLPLIPKS
jgi:aspartyl-tRNA(Asn)/glutamyl-tRNA(Gln) amidotransferase subunit B